MGYSITVQELIKRPIIRTDFDEEWMNKMTDDELNQFDKDTYIKFELPCICGLYKDEQHLHP
jgi:hypothetical protein